MKYIMVDPPKGWVWGFPKRMPSDTKDVIQWLIDNGYPKEHTYEDMHLRMWYSEHEDKDESN